MRTADFDYALPPELIAQHPSPKRDESRLLVLQHPSGQIAHRQFRNLPEYLKPGDVLVLNNSRVIPARLRGINSKTGGQFEILLLEEVATNDWWAMMKPGKRARIGTVSEIRNPKSETRNQTGIIATVTETNDEGHRRLRFDGVPDITNALDELGEVPLPPYINRENPNNFVSDKNRYQTVFANPAGSVAAPTAGLHFTESLLAEIRSRGVEVCFVTLHVGLGTFAPVKADDLSDHIMHEERYEVSEATARIVNEAKAAGRRVIAVGTTSVRVLESAALASQEPTPYPSQEGSKMADAQRTFPSWEGSGVGIAGTANTAPVVRIIPGCGRTRIFIHPPYDFKIVDALLTNFHLPCSTLLMLISAFAAPGKLSGRETILSAYAEAVRERYRFFSYGDAMLIL